MSLSTRLSESKIGTSAVRALYDKVSGDPGIISLSAGDPNFDTPMHIQQAATEAAAKGKTHYAPSQGIPELRQAVANRYQQHYGIPLLPSQVQITAGAANALFIAIHTFVRPGDRVVVLHPTLSYLTDLVILAGGEPVGIWLDPETSLLDLEATLDRELASATMLLTNFPNNPSGRWPTPEEHALAAHLVRKHNCYLVADEVYDEILFERDLPFSTFWSNDYDKLLIINSFSKTYAMTGWRLGYVLAAESIRPMLTRCFTMTVSHIATPTQYAGVAALTGNQDCVKAMLAEYKERRDFLAAGLSGMPRTFAWYPQGGLYFFLNISGTGYKSMEICRMLLEQSKVFAFPGEGYGAKGDQFIRISFSATPMSQLELAVPKMQQFFHDLAPREAR